MNNCLHAHYPELSKLQIQMSLHIFDDSVTRLIVSLFLWLLCLQCRSSYRLMIVLTAMSLWYGISFRQRIIYTKPNYVFFMLELRTIFQRM